MAAKMMKNTWKYLPLGYCGNNIYDFCVQDGQAMLWDLNEGKHLYTLESGDTINALCFSPNRYWLCAATGPSIKIWVKWFVAWNLKYLEMEQWCNIQCQLYYFDDNRGCFWALASSIPFVARICRVFSHWSFSLSNYWSFCFNFCRIWRARSLWMSSDRRWSAQTAKLSRPIVFAWHGLPMDRYISPLNSCLFLYLRWMLDPGDYSDSLLSLMSHDDSPANMRGTIRYKY